MPDLEALVAITNWLRVSEALITEKVLQLQAGSSEDLVCVQRALLPLLTPQ